MFKTSEGCPEQYDAKIDGRQVGYLRLRHGYFSVECPDVGGEVVYSARPRGDGAFYEEERDLHLRHAVAAILDWDAGRRRAPDVDYEVVQA